MGLIFTALEPSYETVGNTPEYRAKFTDQSSGSAADPDSVDEVRIYDSGGTLLRTYTPPDIDHPSTGTYEVTDEVVDEADDLTIRWVYTEGGDQKVVGHTFEIVPETDGTVEKQIKDQTLQMLGQGVVRVEIPAGTLDTAVDRAKGWYAHRAGQTQRTEMQLVAGQQKYDVADDVDTVTDVIMRQSMSDYDAFGGWGVYGADQVGLTMVPAGLAVGGGSAGFNSMVTQVEQQWNTWRTVVGADTHWEWEPGEGKLWIMPAPDSSRTVFVDYVSTTVDLQSADSSTTYLVREYALAEAKEALGRIRSKYDSFNVPGGTTSLDGKDLIQEAQDRKRDLDDEATEFSGGGFMIVG